MEMKLLSILLTSMSCLLFVASLEERLPVSDNVLQREIQELRTKVSALESKFVSLESRSTSSIAVFVSQLSQTIVNPTKGHIVIFDDVITNVGQAYSPVTGVFRAPVDGNYMFSMIGTTKPEPGEHDLHLLLKRNGNTIGYFFLDSNHDYYLKRTEVAVVSLTSGDEVFVQVDYVVGSHLLVGCCFHTHFSGFLIG